MPIYSKLLVTRVSAVDFAQSRDRSQTVDYLAILTGSTEHVAVDSQLRVFVRDAGVRASDYDEVRKVITDAAADRGWDPGALDAAIWAHQLGATQ